MVFPGEGFDPQQTLQVHCEFLLLSLFLSVSYSNMYASQVWLELGAYRSKWLSRCKLCLVKLQLIAYCVLTLSCFRQCGLAGVPVYLL